MTTRPPTGANSAEVQQQLARRIDTGNAYPWLYPTADFRNFDKFGSVALPAVGTSTAIGDGIITNGNSMPWNVPKGYNGFIKALAIEFDANGGAAWTIGASPLPLNFTLTVDGKPAYDYGTIAYSPGLIVAPTPIAGVPIKEGNLVKLVVSNISIVVTTQLVLARLMGYYYGKNLEPRELAY